MSEQWVKMKWDISSDFQAAHVMLQNGTVWTVNGEDLHKPYFLHHKTGIVRTPSWMLGLVVGFDKDNLAKHINASGFQKAFETGECKGRPGLAIENVGTDFTLEHDGKSLEFVRLWFDVELTVRPQTGGKAKLN